MKFCGTLNMTLRYTGYWRRLLFF